MLRAVFKVRYDRTAQWERTVSQNAAQEVERIGNHIINDIRASWSPVSPSAYGEAPAVVTGTLDRSITLDLKTRNTKGQFAGKSGTTGIIKIGAPYAEVLEVGRLNRPFFAPALERAKPTMVDGFKMLFKSRVSGGDQGEDMDE